MGQVAADSKLRSINKTAPVASPVTGAFDVSHETFWGATPLCVLLNFEALLQLSASGVNIVTTGVTNRGLDATGLKTTLKILNLMNRRRLERAALDVVKLNQVNVAQRSSQKSQSACISGFVSLTPSIMAYS